MILPDLSVFDPVTLVVFAALGALSLLAITVAFFKSFQFARLGVGQSRDAEKIVESWLNGRPDAALQSAADQDTVLARVLQAVMTGLQARPDDRTYAEELGRQTALMELQLMSTRMRLLEAVVQAAPMLGLLGTVIGMIDAFGTLSASEGAVDPALLAGGIWTALTTTAIGLAIALVTYFVANWLEERIDRERQLMETMISAAIHGRVARAAAA
ncbi:MotA/TolQ/ExbB proton channel family protein [Aestuariibius sp. 2305UL40-4]|uniref:MotA/TolQ/ExbB proton channel family protein n=1 Tax=Aestuariibius violaceus TaxID=3234132 RepID=UPI00345ED416